MPPRSRCTPFPTATSRNIWRRGIPGGVAAGQDPFCQQQAVGALTVLEKGLQPLRPQLPAHGPGQCGLRDQGAVAGPQPIPVTGLDRLVGHLPQAPKQLRLAGGPVLPRRRGQGAHLIEQRTHARVRRALGMPAQQQELDAFLEHLNPAVRQLTLVGVHQGHDGEQQGGAGQLGQLPGITRLQGFEQLGLFAGVFLGTLGVHPAKRRVPGLDELRYFIPGSRGASLWTASQGSFQAASAS